MEIKNCRIKFHKNKINQNKQNKTTKQTNKQTSKTKPMSKWTVQPSVAVTVQKC